MTPLRWLHATVLLAGRASELTENDLDQMQPAAPSSPRSAGHCRPAK